MPGKSFDYIIASVYGRSSWLAEELTRLGHSVAVVDFSGLMGRWTPEDIEGPFGYFRRKSFKSSQSQRILVDASSEEVAGGFNVWLQDGPLQFRGPVTRHRLQALKIDEAVVDLVEHFEYRSEDKNQSQMRSLEKTVLGKSWICQLAARWASTSDADNFNNVEIDDLAPLFNSYFVRRTDRNSAKRLQESMQRAGVSFFAVDELKGLRVVKRTNKNQSLGIRFSNSDGELEFDCKNMVWSLTSHETKDVAPSYLKTLFPAGVSETKEYWTRFGVSVEDDRCLKVLPQNFYVLNDLFLKWSEANFFGVTATAKRNHYDVWLRLPIELRFDEIKSISVFETCTKVLSQKLRGLNVEMVSLPQDLIHGEGAMRASGYFLYDRLKKFKKSNFQNLYFDGPETWRSYEWGHRLNRQQEILQSLQLSEKTKTDSEQGAALDSSPDLPKKTNVMEMQ